MVTPEHAYLRRLMHIPNVGSSTNCACKELCRFLVEKHSTRMSRMTFQNELRLRICYSPKYNVLLVVSGSQNHVSFGTYTSASELSPSSHLVVVFFIQLLFLKVLHF